MIIMKSVFDFNSPRKWVSRALGRNSPGKRPTGAGRIELTKETHCTVPTDETYLRRDVLAFLAFVSQFSCFPLSPQPCRRYCIHQSRRFPCGTDRSAFAHATGSLDFHLACSIRPTAAGDEMLTSFSILRRIKSSSQRSGRPLPSKWCGSAATVDSFPEFIRSVNEYAAHTHFPDAHRHSFYIVMNLHCRFEVIAMQSDPLMFRRIKFIPT